MTMKISYTESFRNDFSSLPDRIRKIAEKKLLLFSNNMRHPSLRVKKMEGLENIWEGRINSGYRFTFTVQSHACILRRVGTHDILRKEK